MSTEKHDKKDVVVVGYGSNYFCNMGCATPVQLEHKAIDGSSPLTAYQFKAFRAPPWEEDDDFPVDVQCTITSSVFLTRNGKLYTCGTLHGIVKPNLTRTVIPLPLKCAQIATGRHFCLARMEGGLAVCAWGAGHFGQLGLGSESSPFVEQPTVVKDLLPHVVGSPVASVATGYWHSIVVTQAGVVFAFGCNRNGQCGTKSSKEPPTICSPRKMNFENVSTSSKHAATTSSAASTSSSSSATSSQTSKKIIKIEKITAGRSHSVALDQSGQVYCWGANQYGQCGLLTRRRGGVPLATHVEALAKVRIVDVAAGEAHTLALTGGGRVFGWGGGFEGQLGTGSNVLFNPKPKLVGDLDFLAIEAGREWKTQQIQYDQSSTEQKLSESASNGFAALAATPRIMSVKAKGNSSVAISNAGHVYAWGCNDCGNLGLPKPDPVTLTYEDPCQGLQKSSTLRTVETFSFDSSHNVALPQRLDSIRHLKIHSVGLSPTFVWCLGSTRIGEDDPEIGRTMYEVQEVKRQKSLHVHYERILKTVDTGTFSAAASSDTATKTLSDTQPTGNTTDKQNSSELSAITCPPPSDPPIANEESEQDCVGGDLWEEGSSSQNSKTVSFSLGSDERVKFSAQALEDPPVATGKKKRLFSPKRIVKAIVRYASGPAKVDLQVDTKESEADGKGTVH